MCLEAFPADEDTSAPPEGMIRVRCSSLLSQFVAEVPNTMTLGEVRAVCTYVCALCVRRVWVRIWRGGAGSTGDVGVCYVFLSRALRVGMLSA